MTTKTSEELGPPVESFDELVTYLADGCKPPEDWRIGTEHEKFGFHTDTLTPIPYDGERGVEAMLNGLHESFGWAPVMEAGKVIGLKQPDEEGGGTVSLEPGGQFELSGAPLETLHETCDEVNTHLAQVREVGERLGIGFLGLGFSPKWRFDETPIMPKGRYRIMRDYMAKKGNLGRDMMFRSCTVQVNLDFASEADMIKKVPRRPGAAAAGHRDLRQLALHRRQAQRLHELPQRDLEGHRSGPHRHAALGLRRGLRL